jgi:uncharacterized membrane protein YedE/YeeE
MLTRIAVVCAAVILGWASIAEALPITDDFSVSLYLTPRSAELFFYEGFGGLTPGLQITAETLLRSVARIGDVIETVTFAALLRVVVTEAAYVGVAADPPPTSTPEPATLLLLGSVLFGIGWRLRNR